MVVSVNGAHLSSVKVPRLEKETNRNKLGDVAEEVRSNWSGSTDGVPIVGLEHLDPDEIWLKRWDVDPDENTFTKAFRKGQLLLGRRRVYQKKLSLAPCDGICSGDITVIAAKPKAILPELLPFYLRTDSFFDYAMQGSAGSLSPRVKWAHLADYEFGLPPLDQQRELAELLWAANDLKEKYKKLITASDEMLKAKFREMFGECGVKECAVSNPRQIAMFDEVLYDDTKSATKIPAGEYLEQGSTAIFDQATDNLIAGYSNLDVGACDKFPALLFVDHSRVVKYVDRPFFIGADGVKILRIKDGKYEPKFAYYMLVHYAIPSTGYNRHFKWLKGGSYILPPLDLQRQFVEIAAQEEKVKVNLKKSIADVDNIIKGLINQ